MAPDFPKWMIDAAASLPAAIVLPTSVGTVGPEGCFVGGQWGQGLGALEFKLFIPPLSADTRPRPLVVMLHGCAQDPDDLAAGTRMNELAGAQNVYVLYPAQSLRSHPQGCWNWSKAGHQNRDAGEPALLVEMIRSIVAEHGVDGSRVYVAGLSAGGAMAAILGQAYPDIFAAVGIHSDDAPGAANDLPGVFAQMKGQGGQAALLRVPTIVFHGDDDPGAGARDAEQAPGAGQGEREAPRSAVAMRHGARGAAKGRARSAREGRVDPEHWVVHGLAQAWRTGDTSGLPGDPGAPGASMEMLRFFLRHRLADST